MSLWPGQSPGSNPNLVQGRRRRQNHEDNLDGGIPQRPKLDPYHGMDHGHTLPGECVPDDAHSWDIQEGSQQTTAVAFRDARKVDPVGDDPTDNTNLLP
mmetsp:Transcript_36341/g.73917  ORF Transcript_36341/g.73917 Transcript_36341/m.73917 type:complete len:99 (-) Transcript_36341:29-325(-)